MHAHHSSIWLPCPMQQTCKLIHHAHFLHPSHRKCANGVWRTLMACLAFMNRQTRVCMVSRYINIDIHFSPLPLPPPIPRTAGMTFSCPCHRHPLTGHTVILLAQIHCNFNKYKYALQSSGLTCTVTSSEILIVYSTQIHYC
jgi:hypothetical protein